MRMLDTCLPLQVLILKNIIIQTLGLSDGVIRGSFTPLLVFKNGFTL
nr:MAG TPA: hypothetical protein [Caudoviricetes sp.]